MNEETKERTSESERARTASCCGMTGWSGEGWNCPMSAMCGRMRSVSGFGIIFLIPALLFMAAGIWILLDSGALPLLIGGCALFVGLMMVVAALFFGIRGFRSRIRETRANP